MTRPTNGAVAAGIRTTVPSAATWAAFDRLPRAIREIVWAAPLPINPADVENLLDIGGPDGAAKALGDAIAAEIALFSNQHLRRFGYPLPAVASGVAPMRYRPAAVRRLGRGGDMAITLPSTRRYRRRGCH